MEGSTGELSGWAGTSGRFYGRTSMKRFLSTILCSNWAELLHNTSIENFNGIFFRQTDELRMGLPLGMTLANICMCFYKSTWLSACPAKFKPIFYRRSIDHTFLLFPHKDHSALFLDNLNHKHSNINITMECESCDKLPFLHCLVHIWMFSF